MADMSITVEADFKDSDMKDAGNKIADAIKSRLGGGSFIGGILGTNKQAAIAGAIAGSVANLVGLVTQVVADFPPLMAVMKLIKLIFTILLLPLVPILKPLLLALATVAKNLVARNQDEEMRSTAFAVAGAGLGFATMGPIGLLLGAMTGGAVGLLEARAEAEKDNLIKKLLGLEVVTDLTTTVMNSLKMGVGDLTDWVTKGLTGAGGVLFSGITQIGGSLIDLAQKVANIIFPGQKAQNKVMWTSPTGTAYGEYFVNGQGFSGPIPTGPTNTPAPGLLSDYVAGLGGAKSVGDFILSNGQVYKTDPNDVIRGSKGGMGGVTVNINNPSIRSDGDIRELVRRISLELQKTMRGRVSYVGY